MSGLAQSFTNIKELGHGGFSTVYQASCRNIDAVVAIKAVARHCLIDNRRRSVFENELKIMEAVDHPFVVLFYNLLQDDDNFYIVIEHCAQSLGALVMTKHDGIPKDMLEKYVCQIASGLHYLHRHLLVLHRDLTLDNILLDANGDVKIADFGLGKALTETNELCDAVWNPSLSRPRVAAPGSVHGEGRHLAAWCCDLRDGVWSFSVLCVQ